MDRKRIMVVDDEPDIRYLLRKMLEKEGYEVIEARDGRDCLERLKKERPDLILLDIMMPGMLGWEVSKKIKEDEKFKSIPVAMLTVRTAEEDKVKSLEESLADWHISKPIDREKLIETVKWLLETPPKR
ncbi:MAG: response regulator [Candidatus Hydrothermarchaeota archaeon]|nr:response regulator [Candidatus Hydrothermarchaeota archaeon]